MTQTQEQPSAQAQDCQAELQAQVQQAISEKQPLLIQSGGSKDFLGRQSVREHLQPLSIAAHQGIVSYEPTELVITARAGTPLSVLESTLAEQGQMLPFEPPHFGSHATLGGTIACGLSGPRRPFVGAARDMVLGTRVLNGRGEILRFGGEVMKNVAGYDVSRLMTGAYGTLGVLLDISLKVLPTPAAEMTLVQECNAAQALQRMKRWRSQALPLSALCHFNGHLYLRLSGAQSAVEAGKQQLGGDELPHAAVFWLSIREQKHEFFHDEANDNNTPRPLWRLSVDSKTAHLDEPCLMDWGGAVRWVHGGTATQRRDWAKRYGGHATLFRGSSEDDEVFHPLESGVAQLHKQLKQAFDPEGIFNPGRMYVDI